MSHFFITDSDHCIIQTLVSPVAPSPKEGILSHLVSEDVFRSHEDMMRDARLGGLSGHARYDGSTLQPPADTRPRFVVSIETENPELPDPATGGAIDWIRADGEDQATVVIQMVDIQGNPVTAFSGIRLASFFDDRIALLDYQNGRAVRTFSTKKSGRYSIRSNPHYKIEGEVSILAVEV